MEWNGMEWEGRDRNIEEKRISRNRGLGVALLAIRLLLERSRRLLRSLRS